MFCSSQNIPLILFKINEKFPILIKTTRKLNLVHFFFKEIKKTGNQKQFSWKTKFVEIHQIYYATADETEYF